MGIQPQHLKGLLVGTAREHVLVALLEQLTRVVNRCVVGTVSPDFLSQRATVAVLTLSPRVGTLISVAIGLFSLTN